MFTQEKAVVQYVDCLTQLRAVNDEREVHLLSAHSRGINANTISAQDAK